MHHAPLDILVLAAAGPYSAYKSLTNTSLASSFSKDVNVTAAQEVVGWEKYLVIKRQCFVGISGMEYKALVALPTTTKGSSNVDAIESLRWRIEESTACKATVVMFDCFVVLACAEVRLRFEGTDCYRPTLIFSYFSLFFLTF
jgi:hypothetical protein